MNRFSRIVPSLSDCDRSAHLFFASVHRKCPLGVGAEACTPKIRLGGAALFCVAAPAIRDAMPGRREPGAGLPEPGGSAFQLLVPKRPRNHPSRPTPGRHAQSEAPWQLRLLGKGMGADQPSASGDLPKIGFGRKWLGQNGLPNPRGRRLPEFFCRSHRSETRVDPRRWVADEEAWPEHP